VGTVGSRTIYEATSRLWEKYKHLRVWAVAVGLKDEKECIVVFGAPLALIRLPNQWEGYTVVKRPMMFPFKPLPIKPRVVVEMAKSISKVTGIPIQTVMHSKPLREYERKIREEIIFES